MSKALTITESILDAAMAAHKRTAREAEWLPQLAKNLKKEIDSATDKNTQSAVIAYRNAILACIPHVEKLTILTKAALTAAIADCSKK